MRNDSRMAQDIREKLEQQMNQTPQAFHLARPLRGSNTAENYCGGLGVFFRMVPRGRTYGARLTSPPLLGTQAERLELEPGDTVVSLDDYVFQQPIDLSLHVNKTEMVFENIRTGRLVTCHADVGTWIVPDYRASNLEACYLLVTDGERLGARITRPPRKGTPLDTIGLELGDMIIELDGDPIRSHRDVVSHFGTTTLKFVNVRTGEIKSATVLLKNDRDGQVLTPDE
jgi:S1-C subfamily serine protease